eukprot:TRINITY_DN9245_c0_g2_i1.p1 TRINITY_DN9245_c0_g2~~TRINITY_DN9245_c0_g2_i1.p1  ORF type:complete len:246 (+),score=28.60 TRINITY_DN9245_c0_g2_i1:130-867(+)
MILDTSILNSDVTFTVESIANVDAHSSPATCLQINPTDQSKIVTGGEDGTLNIFDLDNLKISNSIHPAHSDTIIATDFTQHSAIISISSSQIKIWDTRVSSAHGAQRTIKATSSGQLTAAQHVRSYVVAGTSDGEVIAWDLRSDESRELASFRHHNAEIWEVDFHPTSPETMLTGSEDGTVRVWNSMILSDLIPTTAAANRRNSRGSTKIISDDLAINSFDIHPDVGILAASTDSYALWFKTCDP